MRERTKAMKIVAIVGSHRMNGNTSYLTDQALEGAKQLGIETTKITLAQYKINPCQGHDECQDLAFCPQEDDTKWIVQKLYEADGIILASPVYSQYITAQLKTFIERCRFYTRHNKKIEARCAGIIVVATSSGIKEASNALIRFITRASNIPAEKIVQAHGFARTAGEIRNNAPAMAEASKLGTSMAEDLLKS